MQNYLYGLTAIAFWPYVLASWIGMIPGTLLYVYLGAAGRVAVAAAAKGEMERDPLQTVFFVAGLVATVLVTISITPGLALSPPTPSRTWLRNGGVARVC